MPRGKVSAIPPTHPDRFTITDAEGNIDTYPAVVYTAQSWMLLNNIRADYRGLFLAGDDVSWTAGWAEGAVTTALNAVWGVMHHFGGATPPGNPGSGDVFDDIAPLLLDD